MMFQLLLIGIICTLQAQYAPPFVQLPYDWLDQIQAINKRSTIGYLITGQLITVGQLIIIIGQLITIIGQLITVTRYFV